VRVDGEKLRGVDHFCGGVKVKELREGGGVSGPQRGDGPRVFGAASWDEEKGWEEGERKRRPGRIFSPPGKSLEGVERDMLKRGKKQRWRTPKGTRWKIVAGGETGPEWSRG